MIDDIINMQKQGEIIRSGKSAFDQLAHGTGRAGSDDDGFQRDAAELRHGVVKGDAAAEQRADFAGAPAEDGDVQIAHAVDNVVIMPADQRQQTAHFTDRLGKQRRLGIVMQRAAHAFDALGKADGQRYGQRIGVFHGHSAFHARHIGGQADVVILRFKNGFQPAQHFNIRPAESNQGGVMIGQLIAGAGAAHGV